MTTHGNYGTPTYKSWRTMIDRCTNANIENFQRYGARGVTVCARWRDSFENFLADMGERPPGKTLDRWPDGSGNYEPGNCRWATLREQRMNQARGSITMEQAAEVRRLRAETGWGTGRIAKALGITQGAANGVIYLGNLSSP